MHYFDIFPHYLSILHFVDAVWTIFKTFFFFIKNISWIVEKNDLSKIALYISALIKAKSGIIAFFAPVQFYVKMTNSVRSR